MAWTPFPTTPQVYFYPGQLIAAADMNTYIRDNMNYLLSGRLKSVINRNNGGNYSTTSTAPTPIDSTNLTFTVTLAGSSIMLFLRIFASNVASGFGGYIDFQLDGVNQNLNIQMTSNTAGQGMCLVAPITGIAAGAHTYKPTFSTSNAANAYTIYCATASQLITFGYWEVG